MPQLTEVNRGTLPRFIPRQILAIYIYSLGGASVILSNRGNFTPASVTEANRGLGFPRRGLGLTEDSFVPDGNFLTVICTSC